MNSSTLIGSTPQQTFAQAWHAYLLALFEYAQGSDKAPLEAAYSRVLNHPDAEARRSKTSATLDTLLEDNVRNTEVVRQLILRYEALRDLTHEISKQPGWSKEQSENLLWKILANHVFDRDNRASLDNNDHTEIEQLKARFKQDLGHLVETTAKWREQFPNGRTDVRVVLANVRSFRPEGTSLKAPISSDTSKEWAFLFEGRRAEVVVLNEVVRPTGTPAADTLQQIADKLDMRIVWSPTLRLEADRGERDQFDFRTDEFKPGDFHYGNAVLVSKKLSVLAVTETLLPTHPDGTYAPMQRPDLHEPRKALVVTVKKDGIPLDVIVTHTANVLNRPTQRSANPKLDRTVSSEENLAQAKAVAKLAHYRANLVTNNPERGGNAVVVCGDFNSESTADVFEQSGFTPDEAGHTKTLNSQPDVQKLKIDYIFASPLAKTVAETLKTPSDHRAIAATIDYGNTRGLSHRIDAGKRLLD